MTTYRIADDVAWVSREDLDDGAVPTAYAAHLPDGPPITLEGSACVVWLAVADGGTLVQPALTEREQQVLSGMSRGRSNAEIGKELYLSEDTVKTHARRLFRKLGARDRAQAVALGFRRGFVA